MFEELLLDPNAGGQTLSLDWGYTEIPAEPTPEEMQRVEEAMQATEAWVVSSYGLDEDAAIEYASTLSVDTFAFDLASDMRDGSEEAWNLAWEVSEALLGFDEGQMTEFWFDFTFDALMDFAYGEDDWDWRGEWSECPDDYL